jgi:hypothetical protein
MTYDMEVGDARTVARVINMAHRFQCMATRVDSHSDESVTKCHFEFAGDATQLDRLRAQIDRIVQFERIFVAS